MVLPRNNGECSYLDHSPLFIQRQRALQNTAQLLLMMWRLIMLHLSWGDTIATLSISAVIFLASLMAPWSIEEAYATCTAPSPQTLSRMRWSMLLPELVFDARLTQRTHHTTTGRLARRGEPSWHVLLLWRPDDMWRRWRRTRTCVEGGVS